MCGFVGIASTAGRTPAAPRACVERMRDALTHRGPDDAGLFEAPGLSLGSRRLAVRDTGHAGHQPMVTPDGRHALAYNGELYNDDELRTELEGLGHTFAGTCDTEVLLHALAAWGVDAIGRLRGMYAFAWADLTTRTLTLARDPLGIKPLYWCRGPLAGAAPGIEPGVVFGSEIHAILEHPDVPCRPDPIGVSAYLTTIRTVIEDRTLFEGIHAVRPGEALAFDFDGGLRPTQTRPRTLRLATASTPTTDLREAVLESVRVHLRSDVPVCCLLSGGLDSSAIAWCARELGADLRTYCAGAPGEADIAGVPQSDDFRYAHLIAERLGADHTEAPVTRERFASQWPELVHALGTPLSTPNEVAIHEVALRLRGQGDVVALSGEGADELFGGYEAPLMSAAAFHASEDRSMDPGHFQLLSHAWVGLEHKPAALAEELVGPAEGDAWLTETYSHVFQQVADAGPNDDPLQAPLRFHRLINLTGLLQRLDTSMMRTSVEGRTPFADVRIAGLAESLPMSAKFRRGAEGSPAGTKLSLRQAFEGVLPTEVTQRPKASFPLPFQRWVADHAATLQRSKGARRLLSEAAIQTVAQQPERAWQFAWPMINLAIWADRWWPDG